MQNFRFVHVSSATAASAYTNVSSQPKTTLTNQQELSGIGYHALKLTPAQREALRELDVEEHIFTAGDDLSGVDSQRNAAAMMATYGLDIDSREEPDNRWATRWNMGCGQGSRETKRILYQCACGSDHEARGYKTRKMSTPFTACLAHAEVTYLVANQRILRIRGHFQHNQHCKDALLARIPAMPLHPSVYKCALEQLEGGAQLHDVKKKNRALVKAKAYPDMKGNPLLWRSRYLILDKDTRSLYRQFYRMKGVKTTEKSHINIDEWLDPKSPQYNKALADAVFHYSPRIEKEERFEACIATPEMKEAAWKYAHGSQIMLDGTFGICEKRVLLFVVMGVDENRRGVPLAFLLFSAPSGNAQTSAGYDTAILTKLLAQWKQSLEDHRGGQKFSVVVAITDTDLKERGALIAVFPGVYLLICRVHLRRSWRNHRTRLLKGKSPWISELQQRMAALEDRLVQSVVFADAERLIREERAAIDEDNELIEEAGHQRQRALEHLDYLTSYWMNHDLWCSWSDFGRLAAARILSCSPADVYITTNHLEAFNRVLKQTHIHRQQRGGRRLRVDVLIHFLIMDMLPAIFDARRMLLDEQTLRRNWVLSLPGGPQLWDQHQVHLANTRRRLEPVAFLPQDSGRDERAVEFIHDKQISAPTPIAGGFSFTCYSSLATEHDSAPVIYTMCVFYDGRGSCTCQDFQHRGGACKHIRAALLYLDLLRMQGYHIPPITLPTSEHAARVLSSRIAVQSLATDIAGDVTHSLELPTLRASDTLARYLADAHTTGEKSENDSDDECDSDESEEEDLEGDEFDFSALRRAKANRQALNHQSKARVFSELRPAAAKIADLASLLEGTSITSEEHRDVASILSDLTAMTSTLRRILDSTPSRVDDESSPLGTPPITAASGPAVPGTPTCPNKRARCISPSPEKRQTRKDSYSYH